MLEEAFTKLIGNAIVAAGRAMKIYHLGMFTNNKLEITPEQYDILAVLQEDKLLHQSELCELLFKDKSNMTRLLSVLLKKELIKKIPKIENKRIVNKIQITKKGKELRARITPFMNKAQEQYLKNITCDDMYTCIKVLSQIQKNLTKRS